MKIFSRIFFCIVSLWTINTITNENEHPVKRIETATEIMYTDGITTAKRNVISNSYEATITIKLRSGVYTTPVAAQNVKSYFDDLEEKYLEQQETHESTSEFKEPEEVEEEIDYMEQLFNEND